MLLLPGLVAASVTWADCCSGGYTPPVSSYSGALPSVPVYHGAVPPMPAPLTCQSLGLVGWWKFDETSGTTAADSAGAGIRGH